MPRVTIVGTRTPTAYGLAAAAALAAAFADAGVAVFSGLAYGVDARAHEMTLASDGMTVAVLGSGPDVPYPMRHRHLMSRVIKSGAVISELPPGTRAAPWLFPLRNRILAALGDAVIVVQAGEKSGATTTADRALELGREVFAVPGTILGESHIGTNRLIQQGAAICLSPRQTVQDFHEATRMLTLGRRPVGLRSSERPSEPPSATEGLVMLALGRGPRTVDEISEVVGISLGEAAGVLAMLELRGRACRVGPGRFALGP
jgi:DNA processing protein